MTFVLKTFYSEDDLVSHLKTHQASFYFSSKTSTVIPYDKIKELLSWKNKEDFYLCDLSKIPSQMKLLPNRNLIVRGAVSWEEGKNFLQSQGRTLKTSPTEQLALITAGVATSCTGERCFGFGNMRSQVVRLKYLNYLGEERELYREKIFSSSSPSFRPYQLEFKHYEHFKNAPYPRFDRETDLMIGTEGQLGIITEVELETTSLDPVTYAFLLLPRWEKDLRAHLEVFHAVQAYRQDILSCELLDANCMNYLKPDQRLGEDQDVIFLEILSSRFEKVYENLLTTFKEISPDDVFEIAEHKFHSVRAGVPRAIFEENSKMGVVKMGTDVQVTGENFKDLLEFYRSAAKNGVRYCLFGHFGDAHLHFNYMPKKEETSRCLEEFEKLYEKVFFWRGSPFAEHGIGLIKQKYIKKFHGPHQHELFKDLKREYDPYHQFFPQGFMTEGPRE